MQSDKNVTAAIRQTETERHTISVWTANARYARVARPDEVVASTGFEPGAVAPFPAPHVSRVLIDRSLLAHELVWIGAGSDRHMAGIAPADLVRLAHAQTADLAE